MFLGMQPIMFILGQSVLTPGSKIVDRFTSIIVTFVAVSLLVLSAIGLDAASSPAQANPEIYISSSEVIEILDGETESHGTEGTGVAKTVTYTIINQGSSPLTLSGPAPTLSSPVNVGTPTVGNYSITTVPAGVGSATFTVTFTPQVDEAYSYDLLINSDDVDESNFDFTASGTAEDLTRPFLLSVVRHSPTTETTSADKLTWRITFNENIVGLDSSDVDIDGTTATIESLIPVSGSVYDLTISGGDLRTLNGEVESSFGASAATITDTAGNLLQLSNPTGADENTYQVFNETIPPRITSIDRASPTDEVTGEDTLTWRVIFNEDVTGVDASDFIVGGTTATVTSVSPASATTYDVTVSGGDLANLVGSVSLSPIAGITNIEDISGNGFVEAAPTGTNNNSYYVLNDVDAPILSIIARYTPFEEITNNDSLTWRFTFNEPVNDFDTADVTITGTTATITSVVAVTPSEYNVTASGGDLASLNAVVQVSLSSTASIFDDANNNVSSAVPDQYNDTYTLVNDEVPPRIASITRHNPSTETTQEDTLIWQFTFDEAVTGVDTSDFTVSGTTGAVTDVEAVSTTVYNVKVAGGDLATVAATVSIDAKSTGTNITDAIGNVFNNATPTGVNENSYSVELPILTPSIEVLSGQGQSVTDGGTVSFGTEDIGVANTVTYTIKNTGSAPLTLTGSAPTLSNLSNVGTPTVGNYSATTLDADGGLATFTVTYTPATVGAFSFELLIASNDADKSNFDFTASGTAEDLTHPFLLSVVRHSPTTETTSADKLTWRITFNENIVGLDSTDVDIDGTTATVESLIPVSGSVYDLTISGGDLSTLNGEVESSFGASAATITDTAGNLLQLTDPTGADENTYQLFNETIPPRIASIDRASPTTETTGEDTLTWRVIFNEDVTGVDASDFIVGGTTATVTSVSPASATTYDVTVSGGDLANLVGTVTLSPIAGVTNIEDISSNGFVDATPTGTNNSSYYVFNDVVGPALISIARQSPIFETTDADSLTWRFTFDEEAVNFDAADVTVSGTTATVSNINAVSSSVYDVTITGGDLANLIATVQISLSSSLTVQDTLGNSAIATVPVTNQNFYTLFNDLIPPRIASITRHDPSTETTQEDTLIWQFTFDEAVTGVDASDFTVSGTTGAVADVEAVSTTVYNVKVAGGDLASVAATVSIDAKSTGTNITDTNGNVFDNATPIGVNENSYNVELPISSTTVEVVTDEGKTVADGGADEKPDEPAGAPITNTYTFTNTSSSPITITGGPTISGSNNVGNTTVSNFSAPTTTPVKKVNLTIPQRTFAFAGSVTMDVLEAIANSIITPAYASSITLEPGESTSFDVTFTPESEGEFSVEVDIVSSVGTFDIEVSGSAVDTTKPSVSINGAPAAHDGASPFNVTFEFSEDVTGFVIGDITVGNGTASNFIAIDGNTYTADITPGGEFNTTIDVASAVATDGAGNTNTAATQVLVSGGTAVLETLTAISNFMMNRANNILSNQPDMIGFVNGSNNSGGGPLGNLQLESDLNSETTMSFFTSRSKILQAREGGFGKGNRPTVENDIPLFASAERFGDDAETQSNLLVKREVDHEPEPQGFNTNDRTGSWDIWTQINGSKSSQTNIKSEFWSAYFGTHYFISNDVLFGVLTQIDWAEEINSSTGSTVSGNGFMVGPYIAGKLKEQNLYFEARTLWGQSSNDVTPIGTYTDNFETERWLASLKVQGSYDLNDEVSIKPEVSISYFKETQKAYIDSNSDLIPEQTISLGEFKFGPTVTRNFDIGNGYTMRATTGISGIANFSVKNANSSTSNAFSDEDLRARVDAKIELENEYGVRFTAAGYYDGIGASDFQSYGGSLGLTVPIY
jgi:hypothetical protein